jgi:serine/threonine protein kinase
MERFLEDIKSFKTLSGLSGCRIYLATKDDKNWFVRKISKDIQSSDRLKNQIDKQKLYAKNLNGIIRVPAIIEEYENDGMFYADMEYISGPDGITYLNSAGTAQIQTVEEQLHKYIHYVAEENVGIHNGEFLIEKLRNKILDIHLKTQYIEDEIIYDLIKSLSYFKSINLPITLCHGDFTMENIIVSKDNIYLLDFLDPPFDHYWQDISKLHQDLSGSWYARGKKEMPKYIKNYLGTSLMKLMAKIAPEYITFHSMMLAINFLRILPYAQTAEEKHIISTRVAYFTRKIA